MERETKNLEYKEKLSRTYLKTVSAFSNYNDGKIVFGVNDDYEVVGIENPVDTCLSIETQINDSIKPKPNFSLRINDDNTITLKVFKSPDTPYKYLDKAYKRNDSATVEVGNLELKRLILAGMNLDYEELEADDQNPTFKILEKELKDSLNLKEFNRDTLKSLNLYDDKKGYNNAALLVADKNNFPGLDIVVYGNNINEFKKRLTLSNISIIEQYHKAIELYKEVYVVEKIEYGERKIYEKVPFNAFREAIANALIHRTWDINANSKVEMYEDKITITTPGGLVEGLSKEQYLNGSFSILRNKIIANIFYRLKIIELFATGIKRIKEEYSSSYTKPIFNIEENSISITLPTIDKLTLSDDEKLVLDSMQVNYNYKRNELESKTNFSKDKLIRILNRLITTNLIEKSGSTNNLIYRRLK